jgi:uncharacterized protein
MCQRHWAQRRVAIEVHTHAEPLSSAAATPASSPACPAAVAWPWQDEARSVCLHKPNVYIDLSGWSPKYFP